jgi:hypothetical protein
VHVIIPFARGVAANQNPNARTSAAHSQEDAYACATAVTFASLRRWNPVAELSYFTNADVNPLCEPIFEACDVKTVRGRFVHEPPIGFTPQHSGSLFILDAMAHFADIDGLYLDPDVLCVAPLNPLVAALQGRLGVLPMHVPPQEMVHGLTRQDMIELRGDLGRTTDFTEFLGGEIYHIPASEAERIGGLAEIAFNRSLERFRSGQAHYYRTEEHIFSDLLQSLRTVSLEPYIRRIWTGSKLRTVRGDESDLLLWHLPYEKVRGFAELYVPAANRHSWFWHASRDEFVFRAGKAVSLHHRPVKKLARDAVGQAYATARRFAKWRKRPDRSRRGSLFR